MTTKYFSRFTTEDHFLHHEVYWVCGAGPIFLYHKAYWLYGANPIFLHHEAYLVYVASPIFLDQSELGE